VIDPSLGNDEVLRHGGSICSTDGSDVHAVRRTLGERIAGVWWGKFRVCIEGASRHVEEACIHHSAV